MDYSPSPSRIKHQYAFLDESVELGRGYDAKYSPRVESPLRPEKNVETLQERQRKFYSKYQDLASPKRSPSKSQSIQNYITTTSRLFKNINSDSVPVDDDVKLSSNMIEKIIRENENLRRQLKDQKREKDLINGFATGLKEKLIKYKKQNDNLKLNIEDLTKQNEALIKQNKVLESLKETNQEQEPKYNFNPDNTKEIFPPEVQEVHENEPEKGNDSPHFRNIFKDKQNDPIKFQVPNVEQKIDELEAEILKLNDNQESKFTFIKNEIESLKSLSLKVEDNSANESNNLPKEDDQIIRESEELNELKRQVDIFHKKLQIREENRLKKHQLNEELERLTLQLQKEDIPFEVRQTSFEGKPTQSERLKTSTSPTVRSPLQETNRPFETLKDQLKNSCDVCDDRPSVNIAGTRWYQ